MTVTVPDAAEAPSVASDHPCDAYKHVSGIRCADGTYRLLSRTPCLNSPTTPTEIFCPTCVGSRSVYLCDDHVMAALAKTGKCARCGLPGITIGRTS